MNEELIRKWNEVVGKHDFVYNLGDIFLCDKEKALSIINRLNGHIFLIRGNHDKTAEQIKDKFIWIKDYFELKVPDTDAHGGKQNIVLMHYAMRVFNHQHRGSYHCYAHSHGSLPDDPNSRSIDVGVDCHDGYPISYDQVKNIMSKKNFKAVDHHEEKE